MGSVIFAHTEPFELFCVSGVHSSITPRAEAMFRVALLRNENDNF
jgi:hypothetical protein